MKLVVPLRMPRISRIDVPASPRSARLKTGVPPRTVALEAEVEPGLAGQLGQLAAVKRHRALVGRNHVLAGHQGPPDVACRRLGGLDVGRGQLGDQIGPGRFDDVDRGDAVVLGGPGVDGVQLAALGQGFESLADVEALGAMRLPRTGSAGTAVILASKP